MGGTGSREHMDNNDIEQGEDKLIITRTKDKFTSTEISDLIEGVLKEINAHDYDLINQHKNTIAEKLEKEFNINDIRYGGSHSTHTDINNISDIDLLADLGEFSADFLSGEVIEDFAAAIRERLPSTTVSTGAMAVTVEFSKGVTIQILPAFKNGEMYRVPDPDGDGWIETYPKRYTQELTRLNQEHSNQVVPTIKLANLICKSNNIDISSYHVSNLALNTFNHYSGPKTRQKMVQYFFNQAKSLCLQPTPDPSGQSTYIDGDYSDEQRQRLADAFDLVENQINEAIESQSVEKWKNLFKK